MRCGKHLWMKSLLQIWADLLLILPSEFRGALKLRHQIPIGNQCKPTFLNLPTIPLSAHSNIIKERLLVCFPCFPFGSIVFYQSSQFCHHWKLLKIVSFENVNLKYSLFMSCLENNEENFSVFLLLVNLIILLSDISNNKKKVKTFPRWSWSENICTVNRSSTEKSF